MGAPAALHLARRDREQGCDAQRWAPCCACCGILSSCRADGCFDYHGDWCCRKFEARISEQGGMAVFHVACDGSLSCRAGAGASSNRRAIRVTNAKFKDPTQYEISFDMCCVCATTASASAAALLYTQCEACRARNLYIPTCPVCPRRIIPPILPSHGGKRQATCVAVASIWRRGGRSASRRWLWQPAA